MKMFDMFEHDVTQGIIGTVRRFLQSRNKKGLDENTLFQGSASSTNRHQMLLMHVEPSLQGRNIVF